MYIDKIISLAKLKCLDSYSALSFKIRVKRRWPDIPDFRGQSPFWMSCTLLKLSLEMSQFCCRLKNTQSEKNAAAVFLVAGRLMQYHRQPQCGLQRQSGTVCFFTHLVHGQKKKQINVTYPEAYFLFISLELLIQTTSHMVLAISVFLTIVNQMYGSSDLWSHIAGMLSNFLLMMFHLGVGADICLPEDFFHSLCCYC